MWSRSRRLGLETVSRPIKGLVSVSSRACRQTSRSRLGLGSLGLGLGLGLDSLGLARKSLQNIFFLVGSLNCIIIGKNIIFFNENAIIGPDLVMAAIR